MQRNSSSASHHHHHHHHSRRLRAKQREELGMDGEAERERPPKKEKRIYRSSLRTRHRRNDTEAGVTGFDQYTPSQIQSTEEGLNSASDIPNPSRSCYPPVEKRARTSEPLQSYVPGKVSAKVSAVKRTASMNDSKRSSPQTLLLKLFSPAASSPERRITCLTCLSDDIPVSKSAKLACSHRLCHDCLRRIFTLSITDPQHMPPRCCTSDHIPLKHVEKLFDYKFKLKWNKKYREYTTKNRIYCPSRGCGKWIPPANIFMDASSSGAPGRKYGICGRCKVKVCCLCNGKWHKGEDCPLDEGSIKFAEVAAQEGWQRCFSCSAMVELKDGCNHITCRCTAQFCIVCGSKWKTCDCPWFNYADSPELPGIDGDIRRPILFQEEIDRRRQQEEQDEALARQLQRSLNLDVDSDVYNHRIYIQREY